LPRYQRIAPDSNPRQGRTAVGRLVIDDRRHAIARRDGAELLPELLARGEVHRHDAVG
jgi:hypothetical protein